jgi:hypothetical protein
MKFFGNALIFLFCSFSVFGQKNITLSGTLLDKADNEPIMSASVELLAAKDSTFVAGDISNNKGLFSFKNLLSGSYVLKVSYIGYLTINQPIIISGKQTSVNLGKLFMQTNDILLQETVIEGKRPEVVVKNDTIEYDAASFKTTENAVIEDLLKKLPGVEVDKDGKITVNGKEVKKFKFDGKDFFSDDPQIASKNLPADMVEKLQVFDQKSDMSRMTGFDDGEEETIINLTIRPGMKQGMTGNALLGAGADLNIDDNSRYQAGVFLNRMQNSDRYTLIIGTNNNNNMGAGDLGANRFGDMRMRRGSGGIAETTNFMLGMHKELSSTLSLNGDIRYNASDRISENSVEQTTLSHVQSQLDKTQTNNRYISNNVSGNFTLEWKPDTMNTLIFRPNLGYNNSRSKENELSSRFNYNNMDTIFDSDSWANNKGEGHNLSGSLDYSHKFTKPGRVFSINLRASYNKSYSYENSGTDYIKKTDFLEDLNQRSENDNNTSNYRAVISWVEPLGRNNFLQALYRISYNDTKSINSTYDLFDRNSYWEAMLNDSLSRSTLRNSIEQRLGLSFKAVRAKYNFTVGFNVDPSLSINETYQPFPDYTSLPYQENSRLANIRGDSVISSVPQDVINFSPVVNFNYIFGQRSNLRINYEGETNQPSASQLRAYTDMSRPTNWVEGNPGLKPGYSNNLRLRFQKYVPETQLTYNVNLNGRFSFNDIVSITQMQTNGIRLTQYENVNGNWNVQTMGMFNIPLKNKQFSINSFARLAYSNQNSFVDKVKNIQKNFSFGDNSGVNYRSDLFDIGVNISVNYSNIVYSVQTDKNQNTFNFGWGGNTTWYLPYNITLESDINYTKRNGYASEYNISETMWNAAVTKQLFNRKFGTGSLKLQAYDILQNRNNISASATTNGFRTSENNVIPSFFICSFIYKFNLFPKSGSNATEDNNSQENRRWGPPSEGQNPGRSYGRGAGRPD